MTGHCRNGGMPCSLAICRALVRRFELPADARRKGTKGRERAKGGRRAGRASRVFGRMYGGGTRRGIKDLCLVREGCGMGRCVRIDEEKETKEKRVRGGGIE